MLTIVQLKDGCYRVTVEYTTPDGHQFRREWTFAVTTSDAEADEDGDFIVIKF